jgi:hypothetical protein
MKDVRFRTEKYTKKIITKELYDKWLLENKEYEHISYDTFKKYWKHIAEKIVNLTCSNTHGVKLPQYMGELSLKYVISTTIKNYSASEKLKEDIPYINLISNGKVGKIVWSVLYARKLNSELPMLGFQSCRKFTKKAYNSFVENPELFRVSKASKSNVEAIKYKYNVNK